MVIIILSLQIFLIFVGKLKLRKELSISSV